MASNMLRTIVIFQIFNFLIKLLFFRFISTIEAMLEKDIADNQAIGDFGAKAIIEHSPSDTSFRVVTHCNTGSLATAGYGTALGVIRTLHAMKRLGKICNLIIFEIYFNFLLVLILHF